MGTIASHPPCVRPCGTPEHDARLGADQVAVFGFRRGWQSARWSLGRGAQLSQFLQQAALVHRAGCGVRSDTNVVRGSWGRFPIPTTLTFANWYWPRGCGGLPAAVRAAGRNAHLHLPAVVGLRPLLLHHLGHQLIEVGRWKLEKRLGFEPSHQAGTGLGGDGQHHLFSVSAWMNTSSTPWFAGVPSPPARTCVCRSCGPRAWVSTHPTRRSAHSPGRWAHTPK